jgi:hypothetical protein
MAKVVVSHDVLHEVLDTGIVKYNHGAEWYPAPLKALSDYSEADLLIGHPIKQDPKQ